MALYCFQGSLTMGAGLKFNLNEDGTKFMRVIAWNQIWMRSEMNPGTMIGGEVTQLEPTLVIDVCFSSVCTSIQKIHDLTHFESTTKLLLTVAQQELRYWWLWCRKNLVYSFMHGMNMQLIQKDKKFSFTVLDCTTTWDCQINDGFNAKLLNYRRTNFNWPLIENLISLPDKWVYLLKGNMEN
jgi:hypothetical protein